MSEKTEKKSLRWTMSAKECYERYCRCNGCFMNDFFPRSSGLYKCQMKKSVLELVKTQGIPPAIVKTHPQRNRRSKI